MSYTVKQIEKQVEIVEDCLNNLAVLEDNDPVYIIILKALRVLDTRLDKAEYAWRSADRIFSYLDSNQPKQEG